MKTRGAALSLVIIMSGFASARESTALEKCKSGVEASIFICTAIIEAEPPESDDRTTALHYRAHAYLATHAIDRAISDLTEVIRLTPFLVHAISRRCHSVFSIKRHRGHRAHKTVNLCLCPLCSLCLR